MGIIIGWVIFSIVVGAIGSGRKIGFWGGFFASVFLSPLVGIIIVAFSKSLSDDKFQKQISSQISILSVPERIEKLVKLKEDGYLTEEEFNAQKQLILNPGNEKIPEQVKIDPPTIQFWGRKFDRDYFFIILIVIIVVIAAIANNNN